MKKVDRKKFVKEQVGKPRLPKRAPVSLVVRGPRQIRIYIANAANALSLVEAKYEKTTTGEVKLYTLEPYSWRYRKSGGRIKKMFFAFDVEEKRIKGFVLNNIRSVKVLGKTFKPRWPVEIG